MEKNLPENSEVDKKEEDAKKLKYTLKDLEEARQWESGFGPNNPRAAARLERRHAEEIKEIEKYLIKEGLLEPKKEERRELTEEEKITAELDKLYPNAESKSIVEYKGKKYQIRYYPLHKSNTGKTVYEWEHQWKFVEEKSKN